MNPQPAPDAGTNTPPAPPTADRSKPPKKRRLGITARKTWTPDRPLPEPAREIFVQQRLRGLSQSAALRIAYPRYQTAAPMTVYRQATEVGRIPAIQQRLAYLLDQAAGRAVADRAEILRRHTAAARARFAPMASFLSVGPDGEPRLDLNPENLRLPAVKKVKVRLDTSGVGDGKNDARIVELEFHDYLDADRETAKILGLYAADRLEVGGAGGGPLQIAWTVQHADRPRAIGAADAPKAIEAHVTDERNA